MSRLNLYDIITESANRDMFEGFDESELSEDYPTGFSFDAFKGQWSYAKKLRYAELYLGKPIGRGSSRVVYRVDNDKVLKLAKNKKGVAQNEIEINWGGDQYYGDIIANVIDYDRDDNLWVEMELAYRAKITDFRRLWGINFKDLWIYLRNKNDENRGRQSLFGMDDDVREQLENNDHVDHLVSFMLDSDSNPGDLVRLSSWGMVRRTDGESLVLIDFGLTNDVYESYYK